MNRYHLGLFFSAIALIFLSITLYRFKTIEAHQQADRNLDELLRFAMSSTTTTLRAEYDSLNDYDRITHLFFESLAAMKDKSSVLHGRIAAEDFYPYVPVILFMEKRYYSVGSFNGTDYFWEREIPYDKEYHYLSECEPNSLLIQIETVINEKTKIYHDRMNLPDITYTLPNRIAMNPQEGTLLVVLENFPTILNGHYYSGIHDGNSVISVKEANE